jgi:hypothetical protein
MMKTPRARRLVLRTTGERFHRRATDTHSCSGSTYIGGRIRRA